MKYSDFMYCLGYGTGVVCAHALIASWWAVAIAVAGLPLVVYVLARRKARKMGGKD